MKKSTISQRRRNGFTLAEVLIVVAIIGILLAVALPNVIAYRQELKLAELDDDARTIFVAAQNELTALKNRGVDLKGLVGFDRNTNSFNDSKVSGNVPIITGEYTYVTNEDLDIFHKLVPAGSFETKLQSEKYVVEFDAKSGAVYAVWYWENDTFNYLTSAYQAGKIENPETRSNRRDAMVGYYGGTKVDRIKFGQMPIPEVDIINAEELQLKIKVPDTEGVLSNAQIVVKIFVNDEELKRVDGKDFNIANDCTGTLVLDTLKEYKSDGLDLYKDWTYGKKFRSWGLKNTTPGEDITIRVELSHSGNTVTGKSEYDKLMPQSVTLPAVNSLFESIEDPDGDGSYTADIAYGRHLQNLHDSGDESATGTFCSGVIKNTKITKAVQTKDINFYTTNPTPSDKADDVYYWGSTYPETGGDDPYMALHPINNNNLTGYNGQGFEIRNMDTSRYKYGGLFSCITKGGTYEGINIVNPHVHLDKSNTDVSDPNNWEDPDGDDATMFAGALVGWVSMTDSSDTLTISNCHVYNEYREGDDSIGVGYMLGEKTPAEYSTATGETVTEQFNMDNFKLYVDGVAATNPKEEDGLYAKRLLGLPHIGAPVKGSISGGMVGFVQSGNIEINNSYASVINIGAKYSGGLIGVANGAVTINNSYAAGFTYGNREVGGLVGLVDGTSININISNSYAAGEIMCGYAKGFTGAGLFHYKGEATAASLPGGIEVKNSYAAVRYTGEDTDGLPRGDDYLAGVTSQNVVGFIYGTFKGDSDNFYIPQSGISYGFDNPVKTGAAPGGKYTDKGISSNCGTASAAADLATKLTGWSGVGTAGNTHAYKLLKETEDLEAYPYPMLEIGGKVEHYGDWLEEDAVASSLCYYEKYDLTTGLYGVWGYVYDKTNDTYVTLNSLHKGTAGQPSPVVAAEDGYCVAVDTDSGLAAPEEITVGTSTYSVDTSTPFATVSDVPVTSSTGTTTTGNYALYRITGLFDSTTGVKIGGEYYKTANVGGKDYWFNPFFACEVLTSAPADATNPQAKEKVGSTDGSILVDAEKNTVVIRTARQLANMATYTNDTAVGATAQGWKYTQLLDINYAKYTDVAVGKNRNPGQTPAQLGDGGSYDGNLFVIRDLYITGENATTNDVGLFGKVTGTLEKIRLVNVNVLGNGKANVGGLVGLLDGNGSVNDCGIYCTNEPYIDSGSNKPAYRVFAVTNLNSPENSSVGGLIGKMGNSPSTPTATNSFAAVKVYGHNDTTQCFVGGFAGVIRGTVKNCYSGGYTEGGAYAQRDSVNVSTNTSYAGGFVGSIAKEAKFEEVNYTTCSVGRQFDNTFSGNSTIGLFAGKTEAGWTVGTDATLYATGIGINTIATASPTQPTVIDESYLTTGNAIPKGVLTAAQTFNYDTTLNDKAYPYDTNLSEHHGDWVTFPMAAYIEKYKIGTTEEFGAYAASVNAAGDVEVVLNSLKSQEALGDGCVIDDFYRVISQHELTTADAVTVDGTTGDLTLDEDNFTDGKAEFDHVEYYVYKFEPTGGISMGNDYYHTLELTVGGYEFYFNPEFGLEAYAAGAGVKNAAPTEPLSKPEAAGKKDGVVAPLDDYTIPEEKNAAGVVIRSARQLANVQEYTNSTDVTLSAAAQGWTYDQVLNVDFGVYTGQAGGADITGKIDTNRLDPAMLGSGSYNGHGRTISNLYIGNVTTTGTSSATYAGLFGYVNRGTVSHVRLVDVDVEGDDSTDVATATGGLVGVLYDGSVTDCGIYVSEAGNYGTFTVSGSGDNGVGGLIGEMRGGSVTGSFAAVKVRGSAAVGSTNPVNAAGGLIGQINATSATITNCYVGGFVDKDSHTYKNGSVNVAGENNVGGFVGSVSGSPTFSGVCYSTASVGGGKSMGLFCGSGTIDKPKGADDKLYAVASAFDKASGGSAAATRDESAYLTDKNAVKAGSGTTVSTTVPYNQEPTAKFPYESGLDEHHGDWIEFEVMGLYYDVVGGTTGYYSNGASVLGHGLVTTASAGQVATDDGYMFLTLKDLGDLAINVGGKSYPLTKTELTGVNKITIGTTEYSYKYEVPVDALNATTEHYYTPVSINGKTFYVNFGFAGEIFDTAPSGLDTPMKKDDTLGTADGDDIVVRSARQLANLGIRSNVGTYNTSNVKEYTAAAQAIQGAKIGQALDIDYGKYAPTNPDKIPDAAVLAGSNTGANHTPITLAGGSYDGYGHVIKGLAPGMVRLYDKDAGEAYVESGLFGQISKGTVQNVTLINAKVDNDAGKITGKVADEVPGVYVLDASNLAITTEDTEGSFGTDNYFTLIPAEGKKYSVTKENKLSWNTDEYESSQSIRFGATADTRDKKAAIKFQVKNSKATVKVWWSLNKINSGEDRRVYIFGKATLKPGSMTLKINEPYFTVFNITEAGTYYLGSLKSGILIHRVEVYDPGLESVDTNNQKPCSISTPPYEVAPTDPDYDGFPTGLTTANYQVRFGALLGASDPVNTADGTVTIKNCGVYVEPADTSKTEKYTEAYKSYCVSNTEASAADAVGGLIGAAGDGTLIDTCFAAVKVSGNEKVGGFIGHLKNATIRDCYSGGHTEMGMYNTTDYNVTARDSSNGYAGGFAGQIENTGATDNLKFESVNYSTSSAKGGAKAGNFAGDIVDAKKEWIGFKGTSGEKVTVYGVGAIFAPKYTDEAAYLDSTMTLHAYQYATDVKAAPYDVTTFNSGTYYPYMVPDAGTWVHHGDWPMRYNIIYYELYKDAMDDYNDDFGNTLKNRDVKLDRGDDATEMGADYIGFYGKIPKSGGTGSTDYDIINTLRVSGRVYDSGYMVVSDADVDSILLAINSRYVNNEDETEADNAGLGKDYYDTHPEVERPLHTTTLRTKVKLNFTDTPDGYKIKNKDDNGLTAAGKLLGGNYGYVIPTEGLLLPAASKEFYLETQINGQTYLFNPQFPCEGINVGVDKKLPDGTSVIDYSTIRSKEGINYVVINDDGQGRDRLYTDQTIEDTLIIRSPLNLAGLVRFSRQSNTGLVKDKIIGYKFVQHMDVDYKFYADKVYDGYSKNRTQVKHDTDSSLKDDDTDELNNKVYKDYKTGQEDHGQVPATLDGGQYNGLNHKISNLWLACDSDDSTKIGLFGELKGGAVVQNIWMENIHLQSNRSLAAGDKDYQSSAGALAAVVHNATIKNVTINNVTIELEDNNTNAFKDGDNDEKRPKYEAIGGAIGKIGEIKTAKSVEAAEAADATDDEKALLELPTKVEVSGVTVIDPKITVKISKVDTKNTKVGGVIGSADGEYSVYASDATTDDTRPVSIVDSGVYISDDKKNDFDKMGIEVSGSKLSGDKAGGFAGYLGKGVYLAEGKDPAGTTTPAASAAPTPKKVGDFAAIRVQGKNLVGGFAGHIVGAHVENCYSGGYVDSTSGDYSSTNYNVVASNNGTAGGFAGKIEVAYKSGNSGPMAMVMTGVNYTTSSVSGKTVGAFAGEFDDDAAEALMEKMGSGAPDNYASGTVKVASSSGTENKESTVKTGSAIPRQDNKDTSKFTTSPYDQKLIDDGATFPFKTNLTVHHGDWKETGLMAAGYWEVEDGLVRLWYVASDQPNKPVVVRESGAEGFEHRPDGQPVTASGYFVVSSDTVATVSGVSLTSESTYAETVKKLLGGSTVNVKVYSLAKNKVDNPQEWVVNGSTFYVNPAYAMAVEVQTSGMTSSTLGTDKKPYEIRTVAQLQNMGGVTSETYFEQTHDIVVVADDHYSSVTSFSGSFDGGEYRILDVTAPVFATLANGAKVHNVIVYAPEGYTSKTISGQGGIAGTVSGSVTIENTIVAGFTIQGTSDVGGLVGTVSGNLTIKNSEATNTLSGGNVGGLVGNVASGGTLNVERSYAGGEITVATNAGGLVGAGTGVTYKNVYSYVKFTSSGTVYGIGPGKVDEESVVQEYWDGGIPSGQAAKDDKSIKGVSLAQIRLDTRQFGCSVEEFVVPGATDGLKNQAEGMTSDTEKYGLFPFAAFVTDGAASGTKNYHYGAVPKAQFVGLFYWEKETIKYADGRSDEMEYHYYAHGGEIVDNVLYGQKVLLDSLCYDHHLSGERASIVDSGYGVFNTDPSKTVTVKKNSENAQNITSLTATLDPIKSNLISALWPDGEGADAQVYELPSSTGDAIDEWTLGGVTGLSNAIKAYPAFAAAIDAYIGNGSGTNEDGMGSKRAMKPLQIRTIQQLVNLSTMGKGRSIAYFAITHDIDGSSVVTDFKPITNEMELFDGNGYRILDLKITPSSGDAALFTNLSQNAEIKNVILYSTDGKGVITSSNGNAAGIVATGNKEKISDCVVAGYTIKGGSGKSIGGIVGESTKNNDTLIKNCHAIVTLDGSGGATNIGGIAGKFRGKESSGGIIDCYAGGSVVNASSATVGGISGGMSNSLDIKDSYSYMNLLNTGATPGNVYAISADSSKATVTNCYYLKDYLPSGAVIASQGDGKTVEEMMNKKGTSSAKYVYVPVDDTTDTDKVKGLVSWGADAFPFGAKVTVDVRAGVDTGETTGSVTVHYGAWPEVAGVAQWEKYTDDFYQVSIVGVDLLGKTLDSSLITTPAENGVTASGYAVFTTTEKSLKIIESSGIRTKNSTATEYTDKTGVIDAINKALAEAGVGVCNSSLSKVYDNKDLVGELNADAKVTVKNPFIPVNNNTVTLYYNPGTNGVGYEPTDLSKEIKIRTPGELDGIPDDGTSGYTFKQTCDIDGSGYKDYKGATGFKGTYDGQGYKILDLSMKGTDTDVGLFASIDALNCKLQNIIMYAPNGATISGTGTKGDDATDDHYGVGGLVGSIGSSTSGAATIENCVVAGYTITGNQYVGGLIGWGYFGADIKNCAAVNDITCDATVKYSGAGGILGGYGSNSAGQTNITNCYSGGTIKVSGDNASNAVVGGICGKNGNTSGHAKVTNCYTYVDLSGCASAKVSVISSSENSSNDNNYYLNDTTRYPSGCTMQGTAKNYADLAKESEWGTMFDTDTSVTPPIQRDKATESYVPNGKPAGSATSSDGKTPQDSSNNFPFPAVVRKVNADGNLGDYVHYGEWPNDNSTGTGDPGMPEGPSFEAAVLPAEAAPVEVVPAEKKVGE